MHYGFHLYKEIPYSIHVLNSSLCELPHDSLRRLSSSQTPVKLQRLIMAMLPCTSPLRRFPFTENLQQHAPAITLHHGSSWLIIAHHRFLKDTVPLSPFS
ncbi:hypothetical protein HER10_EVM0013359 [Colletotrichum scovillei]|uniref:uncharacterized protein n=1 Tax=Colletotrichum scovillei TaxID=1209932 RepID=UPI0015C301F1|nr:uncharacterized protein HER10_EVM0013359 [Colletotrichum scovillei]KAF4775693.1 hypothetical protein HER10_EVM0013359 [Colletotrichum scovillei]